MRREGNPNRVLLKEPPGNIWTKMFVVLSKSRSSMAHGKRRMDID